MPNVRFLLASVMVLFAGCVAGGEPGGGAEGGPAEIVIDPDSGLGAIEGTVVGDEAVPIVGALVGLEASAIVATTDEAGRFLLVDVPPGRHVIQAGALGYGAAAKAIEVVAGEALQVTLVLSPIEIEDEVYAEVYHYTGFFECALAVPGWVSACTYPYTAAYLTARDNNVNLSAYGLPSDLQPNVHRFNTSIRQNLGEFVAEMDWQPTSAAATQMRDNIKCGDYHPVWDDCVYPYDVSGSSIRYGEAVGTAPLRVSILAETFYEMGKDKGKWDLSQNPSIWVMNYVSLPHGTQQVAFQQRFDVWNTVFYNGIGPEGYSILQDA